MKFGGRMRVRRRVLALFAMASVAGVGCSSATIAGNPQPGMTPVDLAVLKTGAYSPEPSAYDADIDSPGDLRSIEARRLLNYVVHSHEIDPEIDELGDVELFYDGESMTTSETFPEKYRPAAVDNKLIAGAYVSRINGNLRSRKKLIVSVLRFPTEAASRKAVIEFDQIANVDPGRHPIPVEGHPEAKSSSADDITTIAFASHGPYVVVVNAGVPQPNQSALSSLVARTLTLQTARLDQQKAIPLDDILDLPFDPDSIMRRALPKAPDYSDPFVSDRDFGPYEPAGALHFERNPAEVKKAFDEGGVDLVGRRGGIVYRARDLAGAFRVQTALVKTSREDEEISAPPGLPDARCVKLDATDPVRNFNELCAVVYGRYVAVVISASTMTGLRNPNLSPRAAAQYAILAKSE
ncbi:DUF7373 family lipoprotein [Nocardia goodfellowii]